MSAFKNIELEGQVELATIKREKFDPRFLVAVAMWLLAIAAVFNPEVLAAISH